DHARAVGTLAIVTATEDAPEAIDLDTLRTDPRLSFNDIYDYIPPGEEEFGTRLFESYMANKNFRFLATESDKYYRANNPISSLRYMASTVAENVLNEASDEAETLVCAREFILPSLRAALIRLNESDQSMMNYIEWYEATQEAKDAARLHISTVTPLAEEGFLITDAYSSTMHERAELVAISKELEGINAEDT
ncbi:hypothetical protein KDA11_06460, partial [Candidatus Saccharibacteria bacterium]|nr:hypothetical protein [Candidatus Saccharibacteria bacterium]